MQIQTTRFGVVTVADEQVFEFPGGLIGFEEQSRFALLPAAGEQGVYYWLQSATDADVAFLVADPNRFFKDYHVSIREETQVGLDLADARDGRMLVICNRAGEWITGNLHGPLVINTRNRLGRQVVLTEKKWTCRQPLVRLQDGHNPLLARAA